MRAGGAKASGVGAPEDRGAVTVPFVAGRSGGSPRTGIIPSAISTGATTAAPNPNASLTSLSDLATRSSCEPPRETLPLFGDAPSTGATTRKASSVRFSGTKVRTKQRSLSDRLTASLITSGLVCGITPSSIRKLSRQPIRVLAFSMPGGGAAASPQPACSSSSD